VPRGRVAARPQPVLTGCTPLPPVPLLPPPGIDRSSPVPFYFQLAEMIEQEILHERWSTGERLPSEAEICTHFRLSRTTVRQALDRLEQGGLIRREKGRGSFVTESHRRSWLLQSVEGFFEDETGRSGHAVSSRILKLTTAPLPQWALDALYLPPRSHGVLLERLRSVDGLVAMYVVNHLPMEYADAVLSMADPNESLYARLRQLTGVEVVGASRTLEAILVGERLGALLELPPSAPAVAVHSVSWDREQRAFDCYAAWLRTDRLTIDIDVGTAPAPVHPPTRSTGAPAAWSLPNSAERTGPPHSAAGEDAESPRRLRWRLTSSHPAEQNRTGGYAGP
jgi:GntR family transcriptional regulator